MTGFLLMKDNKFAWSYPTKLEDFWMADVSFDANLDASNNLGKIFADTY